MAPVTLRPSCISSSPPNASRNSKNSASTNWTVRSSASKSWLKLERWQARDGLMASFEAFGGRHCRLTSWRKKSAPSGTNGKRRTRKWRRAGSRGTSSTQSAGSLRPGQSPLRQSAQTARNENASGQEKIIDAMAALAMKPPPRRGQTRDWHDLEKRKSALFDQWKKGGGVANAAWKALDEKRCRLKNSDSALDGARGPEIARRKA